MEIEKLKKRKKELKLTFDELSMRSGIPKRTLENIFHGITPTPRIDTMQAIERALGLSNEKTSTNIQGVIDIGDLEMYPIPLLGRVVAGVPIESQENLEGYVYINYKPKEEYFALRVFGDSMINAGIPDGAVLIVHKQSYVENGNIVVAFLNGEHTVKYFKTMEDDIYLVPANNNYLPIPVRKDDEFLILGRVVEIRINL